MARGLKKHLKRLNAPKHWMLDKLGGVFAPKPSTGPHKSRECLPLCLILRNRLKYALTYKEVTTILMQRCVKVDGKIRLDKCYPCGIMGTLFFVAIYRRGRVGRRRATSDARMGRWRQKTLARAGRALGGRGSSMEYPSNHRASWDPIRATD
jgi:hypothetical protein